MMARSLATLAVVYITDALLIREPPLRVPPLDHARYTTVLRERGVPFSLRDAHGKDLVAEAARLRRSRDRRGPFLVPPPEPLVLIVTTETIALNLRLQRAPSRRRKNHGGDRQWPG
ncbi:unnamed protein product [Prorocentrum cordatum]|uniref:Uncharacterized protein n=1 Tax=Prorocentrum cordatum TaxID=2364126 RepID=A0ABN9UEE0_9DINO|nr:unnamed protein product [Polarella glacialis]